MKKHYYKLGEYNLYHPELCEVSRHNKFYSVDFKDMVRIIPIKKSSEEGDLLLSFIKIGFRLKLNHIFNCTECDKPTDHTYGHRWHNDHGIIITQKEHLCYNCASKRPGFQTLSEINEERRHS